MKWLKGKKIYSILFFKCPKCQETNLFLEPNPYKLKKLADMNHHCSYCYLDFEPESGYYWGAMMISHALTTILAVLIHIIVFQFYAWDPIPFIISFFISLALLFPLTFRLARAIWINILVDYKKE